MQQNPYDPPPQEEPTHDVPVYPEGDPPPAPEKAIKAGEPDPKEGEEDVDEDDLDPQVPHSPPDVGTRRLGAGYEY
jgi:hypothetical protein